MKKLAIIAICVLASLTALAFGLGALRTGRVGTALAAARAGGTKGQFAQAPIRLASNPSPIPPFLVNDLEGGIVSTAALRGKVVLLNFWATWCGPCRLEIPELIRLTDHYKDKVQVVGISMDDADASEVRKFAKDMGINYPVIMASRELVMAYGGVPALPTTFVVSPDGGVVQKHVGLAPGYLYEEETRALLKMPTPERVETFEDHGQIFLKNASLATELPGVDMKGLTPEQHKALLKRLNSEGCDCGCKLTLAQCRINDTACPKSKDIANRIVDEIASAKPGATDAVPVPATNQP
jgi:thiol-disulfide isomerase/thioredoxin